MNQLEQTSEDVCLYYLGYQKRLEQGQTELPFNDVDCGKCTLERMSIIVCGHFINRKHMKDFQRYDIR
jgi:hypothetical protein